MSLLSRLPPLLLLSLLLLPGTSVQGTDSAEALRPDPIIKDIIITTSSTHLLLFCEVDNAFTPEMIEGVKNGIPLSFDFRVELKRSRKVWFDASLCSLDIRHTLRYDSLKQEYRVRFSEKDGREKATGSLDEARKLMTTLNGVKVIEIGRLETDHFYTLALRARLEKKTLPLNMHYVLPFVSFWDFETDWREVRFRY